jgi:DNA-binding GntR family transcriptional regulator
MYGIGSGANVKTVSTRRAKNTSASVAKPAARLSVVYAALREAILSHRLVPGAKLPEEELATIYTVSRTIVRSALQELAHDRLVKLEPNRGAFVAQPSKKEAREVFNARALVEPRVAALAAEIAKPADVAQLRRHLEEEDEAVQAGNDSTAIMLSARFHVTIATIANQSILMEFVSDLVSRSSLIIALYWRRHDTTCESHAHHALVEAIAQHQPAEASELMASHLADLLNGLDLTLGDTKPKSLAEMLR